MGSEYKNKQQNQEQQEEIFVENRILIKPIITYFGAALFIMLLFVNIYPQKLEWPVNPLTGIVDVKASFMFKYFDMHEKNNFPHVFLYTQEGCGHCETFKPKYESISRHFRNNYKGQISFSHIDMTKERMIYKQQVQYIPTLRVQFGQNEVTYEGEKEIGDVIEWIEEQYKDVLVRDSN